MRASVIHACVDCGKERTVLLRNGKPQSLRCHPCGAKHRVKTSPESWSNREGHPRWRGGRHETSGGYIQVVIPPDDPLIVMADKRGRVFEHRLVMARAIGRPLTTNEHVHHRNDDKQDNRIDNLQLMSHADHSAEPFAEIRRLRARVKEFEDELSRLKAKAP